MWQNMFLPISKVHFKKERKENYQWRTYRLMLMQCFCVWSFLIFLTKAYVVDTHLNCIDFVDAIQMSTHNICFYKEVDIWPLFWRLRNFLNVHFLDCVLIGVCAVNPSHAEWIKMPCPLPTVSQSDCLIQIVDINSHTEWQTVEIQISWPLQT